MKRKRQKLLVVDDDPSVLFTYRLIFEQEGYEVSAVGSYPEAIRMVESHHFDFLICDLLLEGGKTGIEILDCARRRSPDLPCLLLTGQNVNPEEIRIPGVSILHKPVEVEQLLGTIATRLREKDGKSKKIAAS